MVEDVNKVGSTCCISPESWRGSAQIGLTADGTTGSALKYRERERDERSCSRLLDEESISRDFLSMQVKKFGCKGSSTHYNVVPGQR